MYGLLSQVSSADRQMSNQQKILKPKFHYGVHHGAFFQVIPPESRNQEKCTEPIQPVRYTGGFQSDMGVSPQASSDEKTSIEELRRQYDERAAAMKAALDTARVPGLPQQPSTFEMNEQWQYMQPPRLGSPVDFHVPSYEMNDQQHYRAHPMCSPYTESQFESGVYPQIPSAFVTNAQEQYRQHIERARYVEPQLEASGYPQVISAGFPRAIPACEASAQKQYGHHTGHDTCTERQFDSGVSPQTPFVTYQMNNQQHHTLKSGELHLMHSASQMNNQQPYGEPVRYVPRQEVVFTNNYAELTPVSTRIDTPQLTKASNNKQTSKRKFVVNATKKTYQNNTWKKTSSKKLKPTVTQTRDVYENDWAMDKKDFVWAPTDSNKTVYGEVMTIYHTGASVPSSPIFYTSSSINCLIDSLTVVPTVPVTKRTQVMVIPEGSLILPRAHEFFNPEGPHPFRHLPHPDLLFPEEDDREVPDEEILGMPKKWSLRSGPKKLLPCWTKYRERELSNSKHEIFTHREYCRVSCLCYP